MYIQRARRDEFTLKGQLAECINPLAGRPLLAVVACWPCWPAEAEAVSLPELRKWLPLMLLNDNLDLT